MLMLVAGLLITQLSLTPVNALTNTRLGILGDSISDEYQGNDSRGGAYHNVTFNWLEQLYMNRGYNLGAWGNYAEPRRTGFAFNWARSGATASTMLSQGQHLGLAAQVASGQVDVVIIYIGSNDFAPYNTTDGYAPIYNGTLSGSALNTKINNIIANVTTAVTTIQSARPIPIIIATIANWNNSPLVYTNPNFSDPTKQQRVTNAIASTNAGFSALAQSRGLTILDTDGVLAQILPYVVNGQLMIGGVPINVFSSGDEPHNGILGDHIHGGTVLEGIIADSFIQQLNLATHSNVAPITEMEILANAGLAAAPTATTPAPTSTPTATTPAPTTPAPTTPAPTTPAPTTPAPTTTTPTATTPAPNHAPVANNDAVSMTRNTTITITYAQILSNDTDADGDTLTVTAGSLPQHGNLIPNSSGATYTPVSGFVGVDGFTYTISDGHGGTSTAVVVIYVN